MAFRSTEEDMERLKLGDEEMDDVWDSPSKPGTKNVKPKAPSDDGSVTPEPRASHDGEDTMFERQESREAALQNELQSVRHINEVIEGLLGSLDRAKGNMDNVSRTVSSASTLLNTWTRILSQTEHNQRLILNPNWQGATQDVAGMENEVVLKQQAAERHEQEMQRQREAAARKAEEDARKRAQPTTTKTTRGTTRGRVRNTGLGRTPSVSQSSASSSATRTAATRGSTSSSTMTTRRPISGNLGRIATARGRSRG